MILQKMMIDITHNLVEKSTFNCSKMCLEARIFTVNVFLSLQTYFGDEMEKSNSNEIFEVIF